MTSYREEYRLDPTYRYRSERPDIPRDTLDEQSITKARNDIATKYNIQASSIEFSIAHEDVYGSLDIFVEALYYSKITEEEIKKDEADKQRRLSYDRKQYEELKSKFEGA